LQTEDRASYFDLSNSDLRAAHRAIADALAAMGIQVEASHHEVGWGQYELDLAPLDALAMADAIMTARLTVKSIAKQHGLYATFMPKPLARVAGSGMHMHQVLADAFTNANALSEDRADYGLSNIGRSFLAGQLAHARGICAVLAPLVNSYKRLVAGLEAPVYVTWAQLNRSALIRVPRVRAGHNGGVRIELRCVDPSCNPYLALALMVRAGLDGVSRGLELPTAAEEELYLFNARRRLLTTLPTSLNEALEAMEQCDLVSEVLGLNVFERFLEAKRIEWNEYVLEVSPWEVERYLMTY
jgi:glutamine synthetase